MSEKREGNAMSKNVQLHVGTADEMGQRFVDAWKRAEGGEEVNESHLTFIGLDTLLATLTNKRLDLLRHVHRNGAVTVKALADALGRDYKNVHTDVAALEEAGLLVRDGRKVAAPWDELQASISL